jgi:DNA helicase HerA-like ATPase
MRPTPAFDAEKAITELAVGEALVSLLDAKGNPGIVQRALIAPPAVRLGPLAPAERAQAVSSSEVAGVYEKTLDRESAYERLAGSAASETSTEPAHVPTAPAPAAAPERSVLSEVLLGSTGPRGARKEGLVEVAAKSALRSIGSSVGRQLVRGLLGSLLGGATGGGRRRR